MTAPTELCCRSNLFNQKAHRSCSVHDSSHRIVLQEQPLQLESPQIKFIFYRSVATFVLTTSCRHIVNKILNIHAPGKLIIIRIFVSLFFDGLSSEGLNCQGVTFLVLSSIILQSITEWSGEVRSIVYSSDGKSVSVVYRVTLHGIDAEVPLLFQKMLLYINH